MPIGWVALTAFRSYREVHWEPDPGVNVLIGTNGAGKTNLLEGIGFLATLSSFRGMPDEAVIAFEADGAVVRGEITRPGGSTLIEMEIPRRGAKKVLINRSRLRRAVELLEVVRLVTFLPEDLDIVKRGPGHRRDLLDRLAIQLWPVSAGEQSDYERALRQRNAFLRRRDDDVVTLDVWDQRVAQAGGRVMARRARAVAELLPRLAIRYRDIGGVSAEVELSYRTSWGGGLDPTVPAPVWSERLAEALMTARQLDRERRVTSVGPHRDDPVFLLDGHDVRYHGSQGEQRSVALAARLATHQTIVETTSSTPVLLLDDVFSELDEDRSAALAAALPTAQTFITSARPEDVPVAGRSWSVAEGGIS